jgi:hypothetical protein
MFRTLKYRTRNTPLLDFSQCHTNYLQNSVLIRIACTYNSHFKDIDLIAASKRNFILNVLKHLKSESNLTQISKKYGH